MSRYLGHIIAGLLLIALVIVLATVVFGKAPLAVYHSAPAGIMGTETSLLAVAPIDREQQAKRALQAAEAALRDVEAHMSIHLAGSEIAVFNAAPAGKLAPMSDATLEMLAESRKAAEYTGGAFDVTCLRLIDLWKQAGKEGRVPTGEELARARRASSWEQIEPGVAGATKTVDTAGVDLGGVAKGYGIDRAIDAMKAAGATGGLVEVGGDIRCFGCGADGQPWKVGIRNPFKPAGSKPFATLKLAGGGVCTSGNYFRYTEIQGKRYSHIIDPRGGPDMGMPADATASVTVVAPTATAADIWATALSVLGADGLGRLPPGVEAMLVIGSADKHTLHLTDGFKALLADWPEGI